MSTRRRRRVRRFCDGEVVVEVHGEGSLVQWGPLAWALPHWPGRFADVELLTGDRLAVTFKDGARRLLEREDARS